MKVTIGKATLYRGDCADILDGLPPLSLDAAVVDPPYGLSFMGAKWDHDVPSKLIWSKVHEVLKPGAHLLSFFGSRTYHRGVVEIEDAGFDIRDQIMWIYGTGFPKSHDVSRAIDKAAGAERSVVVGTKLGNPGMAKDGSNQRSGFDAAFGGKASGPMATDILAPATTEAHQWEGWGTALKPAHEPIVLARKPLRGTVATNVLEHATGALNIDGCRVPTDETIVATRNVALGSSGSGVYGAANTPGVYDQQNGGRWPANIIHDGSEEVLAEFSVQSERMGMHSAGAVSSGGDFSANNGIVPISGGGVGFRVGDSGSAARFFYCAKASKKDRGEGNRHPTVKPTALMRYLCRLVTPPNGIVLDPFMGSGSTGIAALAEGFGFVGIERDPDYFDIAVERLRGA